MFQILRLKSSDPLVRGISMRIYVSSTSEDLKEFRAVAIAAVWRLGHFPAAMEGYVAENVTPVEKCLRDVASSDLYIGIFAHRYGYVPEGASHSITEMEYRKAREKGIPALVFLLDDSVSWPGHYFDADEAGERIRKLRDELKREKLVSFFKTPDELGALVTAAIALAPKPCRILGVRPADVGANFMDREDAIADLRGFLGDRTVKMVCIIGRGGVGKTWLLSKVCLEIEEGSLQLSNAGSSMGADGIIYLTCRGADRISVERVFLEVAKLLGSPHEETLREVWKDNTRSLEDKLRTLLGSMREGCYLLVLDNFEDVLAPDNTIASPELRTFVEMCLTTPHALRLLTTSRERMVAGPGLTSARAVSLEGLPEPDALALLRGLDPRGELGIRDAPDAALLEAVRLCYGVPRALEAVAAILAADRTLTLQELLGNRSLFDEKVVENLIAEHFRRLGDSERRVMEALAVFDAPVPLDVLESLLTPLFPKMDIRAAVNRLLRTFSVSRLEKTLEGSVPGSSESVGSGRRLHEGILYTLHPLDRRFAYAQIPDKRSFKRGLPWRWPYTKRELHLRAAKYFLRHAPPPEKRLRVEDIKELLAAFGHFVRAGRHDDAYRVLETIDFDCLWMWGYFDEVVHLHETVRGHLVNPHFRYLNLGNLGFACWSMGRLTESLGLYEEAIRLSESQGQSKAVAAWLGNKGLAHFTLGELQKATGCFHRVLEIDREIGDVKGEGVHLCDLAVTYRGLGGIRESIRFSEEGLERSRSAGDRRVESNHFANLGSCRLLLDDLSGAERDFRQGLGIAQSVNSAIGRHYNLRGLAECAFLRGSCAEGLSFSREAHRIDYPLGKYNAAFLAGVGRIGSGDRDSGREAFEEAVERCDMLLTLADRNFDALYVRAAAMLGLGLTDDSIGCFRRALEVCPASGIVMESIHNLQMLRIASPDLPGLKEIEEELRRNTG
jgi:tetratricopeptide (TPR) repeat protein